MCPTPNQADAPPKSPSEMPPPPNPSLGEYPTILLLWLLGMGILAPSVATPLQPPDFGVRLTSIPFPSVPPPPEVKTTPFLAFYLGEESDVLHCCNWTEEESVLVNSFAFSTLSSSIWNLWTEFTTDSEQIRALDGPNNYWVAPGQTLETFQLTEHSQMNGGMWTFTGFDAQELVNFMCGLDSSDVGSGEGSIAATPAPATPSTASPSSAPSTSPLGPSSTAAPTPQSDSDQNDGLCGEEADDSFDGTSDVGSTPASPCNCSFSSFASYQSPCTATGVRTITFDFLPGYSHCDASLLPAKIEDYHCDYLAPLSSLGIFVFLHSTLAIFTVGRLAFQLYHHEKKKALAIRMSQPLLTKIFLLGCASACVCNVFYLGPNTDATCNLRTWSFNIFFTLSYAALNLKLYRVYVVFKRGAVDGSAGKVRRGGGKRSTRRRHRWWQALGRV